MNWVWLLFGFQGRINRARVFLAGLVILGGMALLALLVMGINKLFGFPSRSFGFDLDDVFRVADPRAYRHVMDTFRAGFQPVAGLVAIFVRTVGTLVFLWIYVAAMIKRLHDRDRSGWWIVPFFVAPGLYQQFEDLLPDSYVVLPVALAMLVLTIWGFVEIYVLRGTASVNRFGPDPLAEDAHEHGSSTRGPAWDQRSEFELPPHRASPPPSMRVKPGA